MDSTAPSVLSFDDDSSFEDIDHGQSSPDRATIQSADQSTIPPEAEMIMQQHRLVIVDAEKLAKNLTSLRLQHSDVEMALRVCNLKIEELQQHLATVHQMMGMVQAGAPDNEQNDILKHLNQNIPQELVALEADKHQKEQERDRIIWNIQETERTRQECVNQAEIAEANARQLQAEAQQQQLSQPAAKKIRKEEEDDATRIVEIIDAEDGYGMIIAKVASSLVFIAHVLSGRPAEQQGGLRAGDEILKVNGVDADGMSKEDVLDMLTDAEGTVQLEVRNNKELAATEI